MRLRQGWFSASKSKSKKTRRPKRRSRFAKAQGEMLEDRSMLTATVFVDFGEGFIDPDGAGPNIKQFQTTPATLSADISSGGLQGPNLVSASAGISSSTPIFMTTLEEQIVDILALDYNGDSTVDSNDYLDLKADILDYISQVYEPFNIDIVEAANGTVAGIQSTLTANNGLSVGKNDTYLFVTPTFFYDGSSFLSVGIARGALGIASTTDINAEANTRDDSAIVFAEYITNIVGLPAEDFDNALGRVASHEAGHGLGLEHINTSTTNNYLLGRSDTISSSPNLTELTRQTIVSRVPLVTDSGSPTTYVPADRLGNDPDIGYKSGIQYITGTGANDFITISRQSETEFSVTVTAFDDSSPNILQANQLLEYTYSISGNLDDIRVYGAAGNDWLMLNTFAVAGFSQSATLSFWGMEGDDTLEFFGGGTFDQALDYSVTSGNVKVYYAPESLTDDNTAVETMYLQGTTYDNYFNFHTLSAPTEFIVAGGYAFTDRIRMYAQNGVSTGFVQDATEPVFREVISSSTLPGAIRYTPGQVEFIDFYGSTGSDYVELYDLSSSTSFEFFGGAGFDQLRMNLASTYSTDYQVNKYSTYSEVVVQQELYPGAWVPLQGSVRFDDSANSVDRIHFIGGNGNDSVTMSELLLNTQILFEGEGGTDYVNIDLDGQTVASSTSTSVQYTDGTITYASIYYFSAILNTY